MSKDDHINMRVAPKLKAEIASAAKATGSPITAWLLDLARRELKRLARKAKVEG